MPPSNTTESAVSISSIICIIIGMGLLGGLANFFSTRTDKDGWWHFGKCLVCGIAAAVVMPLFLQTIQSDLLQKLGQGQLNYFVFAGFCLIGAFASRTFLDSLAKQALTKANDAEAKSNAATEQVQQNTAKTEALANEVETVKAEVRPLADNATENPTETGDTSPQVSSTSPEPPADMVVEQGGPKHVVTGVDSNGLKVLKALASEKFTFRTIEGLVKETGLNRVEIISELIWCIQSGFANKILRENGERWYITAKGRKLILKQNPPNNLNSEPAQKTSGDPKS